MMGTTLLPEEATVVGFLPLKTYLDTRKDIKTGIKCPEEKETLVRSMLLKESIEILKCTFEEVKE